ncbi:MAG: hypothetical protein EPN43_08810 [Jatrophihabitans sp.]|nr:MAG: hypothetical protein EPN43_08810 [Jatrophihabitans sp.]
MKRLSALLGIALVTAQWCAPSIATVGVRLRDPQDWLAAAGPDAVVAALAQAALGAVAAWTALGLSAALAATLPGAVGAVAGRVARGTLPPALYRLAAGAAGLGVVLAPVAAAASAPPPVPAPTLPVTATAITSPAATGTAGPTAAAAPTLPVTPARDTPARGTPAPDTPAPDAAAPSGPAPVTVVVGDSLWTIAAAHLPGSPGAAQVAAAWPRWYEANRTVIGADPGLIHPGQVLAHPQDAR